MPVTEPEPPAVEETAPGTPAPAEMEPVPQRTGYGHAGDRDP